MDILIVDDSNEKIGQIVSAIREISENFNIITTVDCVNAQQKMAQQKFDLLIIDLLLPLRKDDEPTADGGKNLVTEIERSNRLISPNYILGITQYEDYLHNLSPIWNVLLYSPATQEWRENLKKIILHIQKAYGATNDTKEAILPHIFFEGESDHILFSEAIKIFYPNLIDKVTLRFEKSGGAAWVARQIIIWANSLNRSITGSDYVKAIGVLDGDKAGNDAKSEINRVVRSSSSGATTFKVVQLSPSHARELIPLYQKKIIVPVTLEELIPIKYRRIAFENGWLTERKSADSLLKDPTDWDKINVSLKEHIKSLGLTVDEELYLMGFKLSKKVEFISYLMSLPMDEKEEALENLKYVLEEIDKYFFDTE